MTSTRDDSGVAVVWALALISVLVLGGLLAAAVGQQGIERQRAASAADLAALAGAQALGDPCGAAAQVATANDAQLLACTSDGADVVVRVSRPAPPLVVRLLESVGRGPGVVVAEARAGPPDS